MRQDDHVVILHPKYGLYLGQLNGTRVWSRTSVHGVEAAYTFVSYEQAVSHIVETWPDDNNPCDYDYAAVHVMQIGERMATVAQLIEVGLEPYLGTLPFAREWTAEHFHC